VTLGHLIARVHHTISYICICVGHIHQLAQMNKIFHEEDSRLCALPLVYFQAMLLLIPVAGKIPKKLNPIRLIVLGKSQPWMGRYNGTDKLPCA
jgi:hypothetical protein